MAGTKNNHNEQGSDQNQNTKLPFEDADETMCDADVADDITSADYYFDSYSHFGNKKLSSLKLLSLFSSSPKSANSVSN